METYEKNMLHSGRLITAFYELSREDQTTLIMELWDVREAAEEMLFQYFADKVDDGQLKAPSKKKAIAELEQLAELLRKESQQQ